MTLSSHAWRLVGAMDRRLPISRGRSMVRRSKAPPYKPTHHHLTTAPRQRGMTAAVAPHIHARLPAVERAWDDGWRVRCIETSALGRGGCAVTHLGRRPALTLTLPPQREEYPRLHHSQQRRHIPCAPRRTTTKPKHPANPRQSGGVDGQPTRNQFIHHSNRLSLPPVPACDRRARVQRKDLVGSRSGATNQDRQTTSPA